MGWDRVVDDDVDERNVETSRGDVRRDEDATSTALELVERAESRRLTQLAVERDRWEAEHPKDDRESLRVVDSRGEDDNRVG